ncbi:major facilitator superfamily permease [Bacteroidia bacterium]|nr:major facilitator superfamily permease [Bacteroidia bacterium]GHV21670.1 major facilitator superfamily permease [Bacteroidia bacterium]
MYRKNLVHIAACIGMAFFGIAFIVMGSVLPSLTEKYSLDTVGASSLVTFLPVGVLLGSLVFGPVVDRFGYKMLLIVSTLVVLSGIEGLSFFDHLTALRVFIFFIGLGGGMLNGATNALASDVSDDSNRNSKLSILGVFYGVGALIVPFLLGVLSKHYSYEIILRWTGIFMFLCVVYFIAIEFPEPKFKQGFPVKQAIALLKQPVLLILSFFLFFQSGMEGLFNNWTTSYLKSATSVEEGDIVLILTFFVLGMTAARLLLSYLFKKIKQIQVLTGGMTIVMIGIILLNWSSSFPAAAFSLFLVGFGLAAGFPVAIGLIGSVYKETSGTAIGIALFIALGGNSVLNYAMGYISKTFGINSFPVFLVILLVMQSVIVFTNPKIINNKS